MKKIRITLTKDGAQASCLLEYQSYDHPANVSWSGNVDAFPLRSGQRPDFGFPIDSLPGIIAHQAAQSGAQWVLTDLGGEAVIWEE